LFLAPKNVFMAALSQFRILITRAMPQLSTSEIKRLLAPYGVVASDQLCAGIQTYIALLLEWNKKISLTTVTDAAQIVRFHFGESLFAASAVPIRNGRLADVGSGAGFPAIPLSMDNEAIIAIPIESNSKKSTFQSEIVRRLGLKHVLPYRGRMEEFEVPAAGLDWVIARALGMHADLVDWAKRALAPKMGRLVLWVGEDDATILSRSSGWTWHDPIKIPDSERRYLLVGTPIPD
jgi:16S rRNA (guanine527-N7)-methyltransferase